MAKDNSPGKFQFVFLNLEADQETIQEAVRQAGMILNRGMNTPQQPRTLIAVPVSPRELPTVGQNGAANENATEQQIYEVVEEAHQGNGTEATVASVGAPVAKQERKKKAPRTPALLKDFDPNVAEVSLEDFAKQKDTSTQTNKYLVIAAW